MINLLLRLHDWFCWPYYVWFRRKNGYPCMAEFESAVRGKSLGYMNPTTNRVFVLYLYGHPIEEIAKELLLTHERVRQIVLKIWRNHK
jgi:hypothetical protein